MRGTFGVAAAGACSGGETERQFLAPATADMSLLGQRLVIMSIRHQISPRLALSTSAPRPLVSLLSRFLSLFGPLLVPSLLVLSVLLLSDLPVLMHELL